MTLYAFQARNLCNDNRFPATAEWPQSQPSREAIAGNLTSSRHCRCMKVRNKHGVFAQGLEGVGQPGRLHLLEERVSKHERTVQRMKGVGGGFSVLLTMFHVAMSLLKR